MENLIVEVSKYLMIILFACYAYECFRHFAAGSVRKSGIIFLTDRFFNVSDPSGCIFSALYSYG